MARSRARSFFADCSVLVTGGASGIGLGLATALTRRGASVTVADVVGAEKAADRVGCEGVELDVTDRDAVGACIRGIAERHGRLDYVFNNAGIVVMGEARSMSYDDWARVLDVNVRGVVNGVHAAYPIMIAQGGGHIVNTASAAGLMPTPGAVPYSASKHAVVGLSRALRAEGRRHGVKVTALCPGFVRTAMPDTNKMVGGIDRARAIELIGRAMGWMDPEDLVREALAGVKRNDAVIVAPRSARVVYALTRHAPPVAGAVAAVIAGQIGKLAEDGAPAGVGSSGARARSAA